MNNIFYAPTQAGLVSPVHVSDLLESINPAWIDKLLIAQKERTYDKFPSKLLKMNSNVFSEMLFPVFSSIIFSLKLPEIWKTSYVIPLFGSGSCCSVDNCRPISLLPKISIAFESTVFNFSYLNVKHKLKPNSLVSTPRGIVPCNSTISTRFFTSEVTCYMRCT